MPGCIGDVQHATERMAAFLRQMEVVAVAVERNAPANELSNRLRAHGRRRARRSSRGTGPRPPCSVSCTCSYSLSAGSVTAAMPPCAQSVEPGIELVFGQHRDPRVRSQMQRRGESGSAAADDQNVVSVAFTHRAVPAGRSPTRASINDAQTAEYAALESSPIPIVAWSGAASSGQRKEAIVT